ncbi:hypothetical protein [Thalassotalea sp. SU-HH00458]|uniref:hypothetical protein n=1 Tax=Thalassotalea sp. SU-HH00458 TaxID=3127657 RepID=UPI0031070D3E
MNISHSQDAELTLDENFNYITLRTAIQKNNKDNNVQLDSTLLYDTKTNEDTSSFILGYN